MTAYWAGYLVGSAVAVGLTIAAVVGLFYALIWLFNK